MRTRGYWLRTGGQGGPEVTGDGCGITGGGGVHVPLLQQH